MDVCSRFVKVPFGSGMASYVLEGVVEAGRLLRKCSSVASMRLHGGLDWGVSGCINYPLLWHKFL